MHNLHCTDRLCILDGNKLYVGTRSILLFLQFDTVQMPEVRIPIRTLLLYGNIIP